MRQFTFDDFNDSDGDESGVPCPTCERDDFDHQQAMRTHHVQAHGESIATREYTCDWCDGSVARRPCDVRGDHVFCDQSCQKAWESDVRAGAGGPNYRGGRIEVECAWCDGTKRVWPNRDDGRNHYCSGECMAAYRSQHWRGPDHNSWRGGYRLRAAIVASHHGPTWERQRDRALERDDHACQMCETNDGKLDVHHIVPVVAGGMNGLWNLITLCPTCHGRAEEVASEYGTFTLREVTRNARDS